MQTPNILVVDDDEASLEGLRDMLTSRLPHAHIEAVHSGAAALARVQAGDFDVIISDIRMPGIDGMTLMGQVHVLKPGVPVLLVTGHGDGDIALQALRQGAVMFLQKPLDREHFMTWVHRAIQLRRLCHLEDELAISQRASREQALVLEEHRARLAGIVDTVPCVVIITDPSGVILMFNRHAEDLTGFTETEMRGTNILALIPESWRALMSQRLSTIDSPDHPPVHEHPWMTKSGETTPITWQCRPLRSQHYEKPCLLGVGITPRIRIFIPTTPSS
jgi:PAS domain S-box-containing protein